MPFHHVAITTKDLDTTHRFYTEAMGFDLVKVEAQPTAAGWARHLFYDTGNGELLAVWDINDDMLQDYKTDISTGLGLPPWANHIAFHSPDLDDLDARLKRWLDNGLDAVRIDHDWCVSIYADDQQYPPRRLRIAGGCSEPAREPAFLTVKVTVTLPLASACALSPE